MDGVVQKSNGRKSGGGGIIVFSAVDNIIAVILQGIARPGRASRWLR